jgi:hypothetical protein
MIRKPRPRAPALPPLRPGLADSVALPRRDGDSIRHRRRGPRQGPRRQLRLSRGRSGRAGDSDLGGRAADARALADARADLVVVDGGADALGAERPYGGGVAVFIHDPRDFRELADSMMALGILVDREKDGIRAAARLTGSASHVRAIIDRIPSSRYPRVFWEAGENPLATCGTASLAHSRILAAGGKDIFQDRGRATCLSPRRRSWNAGRRE